ncbi:MAG: imidazole glycerol phosphate synthase subunit HisH [Elusimicrobia bacterium]|nr:imidazole glycerol phosphate synthase subunit HisH [Elusimicrobiota bacterium]
MPTPLIAIADYDIGNLFNVERALARAGGRPRILKDPSAILKADKLVLPGVGSFESGIGALRRDGLADAVIEFCKTGKSVLGICLGMQLLMSESEENGLHRGLGIVRGRVLRFQPPRPDGRRHRIPQISWNSLDCPPRRAEKGWAGTILDGLPEKPHMYFVHSYHVQLAEDRDCVATTSYGLDTFTSVLTKENVSGCQFHSERSGELGLELLRNFVRLS